MDAIYKHLDHEYRIPFLLMADHGLRVEEALNMKVEDINEANGTMTFIGKGSKYRTVPFMSDRLEEELDKVLDKRIEGPLSINEKTGKPYVTMWKPLKQAVKEAGKPDR